VVGFLLLFWAEGRPGRAVRRLIQNWSLLAPALVGLGMLAVVFVTVRYLPAFVVLLWAAIFAAVRLEDSGESRRLMALVTCLTLLGVGAPVAADALHDVRQIVRRSGSRHEEWEMAEDLMQRGLRPGDKVATLGNGSSSSWAHLARLKVVAEVPGDHVQDFWQAPPSVKLQVFRLLSQTGAKLLVTEKRYSQEPSPPWQRLGGTKYFVHRLDK